MLLRSLLLVLLAIGFSSLSAQEAKPQMNRSTALMNLKPAAMPPAELAAFLNPSPGSAVWNTSLVNIRGIQHPGSPEKEAIKALKQEKLIHKLKDPGPDGDPSEESITADPPAMFRNFQGNLFNGWFPPDNALAISDNGYIVSVVNSNISIYGENGNALLANAPLGDYFDDLGLSDFFYDPKVIYDADQDKFIFVVLHGNSPSNSKIIVNFSKSQNPTQGWWTYVFDGNFLGNNTWFDFPSIGVSGEDLFISGNLFNTSDIFNQSVILQIDKQPGFAGGALNWEYFENVTNGLGGQAFTVVPVSFGYDGSYGPGIYLVSTQSGGGNYAFLYDITGNVEDEQDIFVYEIGTGSYSPSADAGQQLTPKLLDVGDCRVLSSFYADGIIHYVHLVDYGGGYGGIRYNRMNVAGESVIFKNYGQNLFDYAYPSVVGAGVSATDKEVIIGFLRSSKSSFPEFRAVSVDDAMEFSSSIPVKSGEYFINVNAENVQRWGDYSGAQRKHSAQNPIVWVSGCYGKLNSTYGNWIAELSLDLNAAVSEVKILEDSKVFPNPVLDNFSLEFELAEKTYLDIQLYDAGGNLVRQLFQGRAKAGDNRLSFNKDQLPAGAYFLVIKDERQIPVRTEKIIVAH